MFSKEKVSTPSIPMISKSPTQGTPKVQFQEMSMTPSSEPRTQDPMTQRIPTEQETIEQDTMTTQTRNPSVTVPMLLKSPKELPMKRIMMTSGAHALLPLEYMSKYKMQKDVNEEENERNYPFLKILLTLLPPKKLNRAPDTKK